MEREHLKAYLLDRFYREDWHGVSDAANDLRELDAETRGMTISPAKLLKTLVTKPGALVAARVTHVETKESNMPSKSKAQAKLMRAVEHGWKPPGGKGPSVKVAKEFTAADKARGKRALSKLPARAKK